MSISNRSTLVWFALICMTILSVMVGDYSTGGENVAMFILGLVYIKGQLIVDHFMGMRDVKLLWRILLTAYLLLVVGLIALSYTLT